MIHLLRVFEDETRLSKSVETDLREGAEILRVHLAYLSGCKICCKVCSCNARPCGFAYVESNHRIC